MHYMHLPYTVQRSAPPTSRHLSRRCSKLGFAPSAGCSPGASWATQVPHQDASYMLLPAATCFVCPRLAEQLAWGLTGAGRVLVSEATASRCVGLACANQGLSCRSRRGWLRKGCTPAGVTCACQQAQRCRWRHLHTTEDALHRAQHAQRALKSNACCAEAGGLLQNVQVHAWEANACTSRLEQNKSQFEQLSLLQGGSDDVPQQLDSRHCLGAKCFKP